MSEKTHDGKGRYAPRRLSEDELHERIRGEYHEMPGMRLTARQAARLFNLDLDDCARALEALVVTGALSTNGREFHSSKSGRRFA
jgi:hypothetical protein